MAKRISDMIIHLDYEDEYKDGKVEVNIIASEPEELVRCKDCESWQTDWKPKGCEHEDAHFCEMIGRVVCADHYCGYAERKKDK